MPSYTAPPIPPDRVAKGSAVELVFQGVEQAGPSFEARVFLNNPAADEHTPKAAEAGYAGSFHVYGYGEPAPPAMAEARQQRPAGGPPVAAIEKRVRVDKAALRIALDRSDALTVTVVPVMSDPSAQAIDRPFERVDLIPGRAE